MMRAVSVFNHLTLDGVMQAPGSPEEDRRGGFEHGGWSVPYGDEVLWERVGSGMREDGALLLGRRTYEAFAAIWPHQPDDAPFARVMNRYRKHVASRTLSGPLEWSNSTLLEGDAAGAVARLKEQDGPDLVVLGSGELIRSLMPHGLIDRYLLTIHPLVLGGGIRLFTDDAPCAALRLVDVTPTTTGVLIASYEPA
jgi:dihydrofolate reductase